MFVHIDGKGDLDLHCLYTFYDKYRAQTKQCYEASGSDHVVLSTQAMNTFLT